MGAGLRKGGKRDSLRDTFQKCVRAIKREETEEGAGE